jgi:hypothetical protein
MEDQDYYCRNFDTEGGQFHVEMWRSREGLEGSVTLPSCEVIPFRYNQGKLESRFIKQTEVRGVHGDLIMIRTVPVPLSWEVREVILKAISEFSASRDSPVISQPARLDSCLTKPAFAANPTPPWKP